ncbi:MAG TPA: NUDIX domain-containing protein [Candidatus Bathyarchaeia archaeon]|nr:NUDIX domain-containing protein [Candidatus Bathyarchaeia archaeon]
MHSTKIVTVFLTQNNKFLILKRSEKVKTMKSLWAGISGIIEGNEDPLYRAKKEIWEETGIPENCLTLIKSAPEILIDSPQYDNHEWVVFPFLFSVQDPTITLNWENKEYRWVIPQDIKQFETVPSLERVLSSLL